jgi:hypothetical protein
MKKMGRIRLSAIEEFDMVRDAEEPESKFLSSRVIRILRWCAVTLLVSAYAFALYLLFSYDFWWLGSGPDSPLELIVAALIFLFLLGTAVGLYADWRQHPGFRYLRTMVVVGLVALMVLDIALLGFTAEARLCWPTILLIIFGLVMPLLCMLLPGIGGDSLSSSTSAEFRLARSTVKQLKLPILIGTASAALITLSWWWIALPRLHFPDSQGTIVVAKRSLTMFPTRNGSITESKWVNNETGDRAEFSEFFCALDRRTVLLGNSGAACHSDGNAGLFICDPFDTTFLEGPKIQGAESCISMDYNEQNRTFLFCGRIEGKSSVVLLDSTFSPLADYTKKLDVINPGDNFTGYALFLDSVRLLVVYPDSCVIVSLTDGTRHKLAQGGFLALSPDRKWTVMAEDKYEQPRHFLVNTEDFHSSELNIERDRVPGMCFSPDSKQIVYFVISPRLVTPGTRYYIYDLTTKTNYKTRLHEAFGALFWLPLERRTN